MFPVSDNLLRNSNSEYKFQEKIYLNRNKFIAFKFKGARKFEKNLDSKYGVGQDLSFSIKDF